MKNKTLNLLIATASLLAATATHAQTLLWHTNSVALQWSYPTNQVTPDLSFILLANSNEVSSPTNWTQQTNYSSQTPVVWNGVTYPIVSGTSNIFVLPIPNTGPLYYSIAASNITGLGLPWTNSTYPAYIPIGTAPSLIIDMHP